METSSHGTATRQRIIDAWAQLVLLYYLKTYGQDKVLFGTTFPQLPWARCIEQVQRLELSPEIKAKFLAENARRVFQLE